MAFSSFSPRGVPGPGIQCLAFHKSTHLLFITVTYWKWLYFVLESRSEG